MTSIGMFMNLEEGDPELSRRIDAFKNGLAAGDVEIILTYGGGQTDTYQTKANELVALDPTPDVLFASCGPSLWALQVATRQKPIPIVFAGVIDPFNDDRIMSDSKNVTGFVSLTLDVAAQLIDTLRKIAPKVTRLAVISDPTTHAGMGQLGSIVTRAAQLEIPLTTINAPWAYDATADDWTGGDAATDDAIKDGVAAFAETPNGGLIVPAGTRTPERRQLIIGLAAQFGLPAVYANRLYVELGGLISHGDDTRHLYQQAGGHAGQILSHEKEASELDIVTNSEFEIVIKQSTADALGLVVPAGLGTVIR
jgi:putative tryptophan/tyrosine transport system substrate-binding protein